MCEHCGCSEAGKEANEKAQHHHHEHMHHHGDGNYHHHHGDGDHHHHHERGVSRRKLELEESVLAKNDLAAHQNRQTIATQGALAVNLISSPGAGKTTLLARTLDELGLPCAVIVGDQQTDRDAKRLSGKGHPVRQIETVHTCHLDAEQVQAKLPEVLTAGVKLLLIENVGNLICPASFDLGEHKKIVLLSVTEGEDKPVKYPVAFGRADVVVITKVDLAPHVGWDREACLGYLKQACPTAAVIELSAKTGQGFDHWLNFLAEQLQMVTPTGIEPVFTA